MPTWCELGGPGAHRPSTSTGPSIGQASESEYSQRSTWARLVTKSGMREITWASGTSSGTRWSGARNSIGTIARAAGLATPVPISNWARIVSAVSKTSADDRAEVQRAVVRRDEDGDDGGRGQVGDSHPRSHRTLACGHRLRPALSGLGDQSL